eukprot:182219_1
MGTKHTIQSVLQTEDKPLTEHTTQSACTSNGSYSKYLTNGYIKRIQGEVQFASQIPMEIIELINDFYCAKIILIYINEGDFKKEPFEICITDFWDTSRKYKANLKCIRLPTQKDDKINHNVIQGASMYFSKNIHLPQHLTTQFNCNSKTQFDVIFRCGGMKHNTRKPGCNALVWKSNIRRHGNKSKTLNIIDYQFPNIPSHMLWCNIVYSEQFSTLYAVSGQSVCELDMNECSSELCWKHVIGTSETSGYDAVNYVMIEKDDREQILMVNVNGSGSHLLMFDPVECAWKQVNTTCKLGGRTKYGIMYDKSDQMIYVGGGHANSYVTHEEAAHSVGYCDLVKQVWNTENMPLTLMRHDHYPILWKDGHLLYIASVKAKGFEWIDLRGRNRKWHLYNDSLNTYFDTDIHSYNAYRCRLLR